MSEFGRRFETLKQEFLSKGYRLMDAMCLAIEQIQYEVRTTGHSYDSTIR